MKNNTKTLLCFLAIISIITLYLGGIKTYTSYEAAVEEDMNVDIAQWNIFIDGENVTSATKEMKIQNVEWVGDHTRDGKVAPGSKGIVKVEIVPQTEVAMEYRISYVDHTMDPNIILTVNSISLEGDNYIKDSDNSFTGIISLEQIMSGKKMTLTIDVEWVNDEANNEVDSNIAINGGEANYLSLVLDTKQYMG